MGKILLKVLALVSLLVIVLVVGLIVAFDPNQYKPTIEEAILDNTGLQLEIAGDLSLTWRPYVGVILNDVRLRNPSKPQELASSSRMALRVDPQQLIRGRLLIEELSTNDLHINWFIDAEGSNAWNTGRIKGNSGISGNRAAEEESDFSVNFSFISIANASIDIQNLQQGNHYSVQKLNVSSRNTNFANRPFDLEANFELIDNSSPKPLPVVFLSENLIDIDSGKFSINDFQLVITPLQIKGNLQLTDVADSMSFSGALESNSVSLEDLRQILRETDDSLAPLVVPGTNPPPSEQVSFQASFSGDRSQAQISSFQLQLNDSLIDAEASIRFANQLSPTNVSYSINADAIDLDSFLKTPQVSPEPDTQSGLTAQPATTSQDEPIEIPKSLLSGKSILGSISIASLTYKDLQIDNINLLTILENGVLDIESQAATILNGTLQGHIRLDSGPTNSELVAQLEVRGLNMADLALPLLEPQSITGNLDLETDFTSTGNTVAQLQDNLRGTAVFKVVNNYVNIGIIRQQFTSISALSPTGDAIAQWPSVMRFSEFSGYSIFTNGVKADQQFKVRMDNIDIAGTGGWNTDENTFAYNFQFTALGDPYLQTIPINPRYHNVSWPVQCNASFDAEINQYCRPDFSQVRTIFEQIGRDELQNPLQ